MWSSPFDFCRDPFKLTFLGRIESMNDDASNLDQNEEEVLTHDVSDEALEAAAEMAATLPTASMAIVPPSCC
jgi:hypothetical protein